MLLRTVAGRTPQLADSAGLTISACGVALPKAISNDGRRLQGSPTLPQATGYDFADLIVGLGLPKRALSNDSNVVTIAEWHASTIHPRQMVFLRLGTGVGGAVVSEGQLLCGATGLGCEIDHIISGATDLACQCGAVDCLEVYAGGAAIERRFSEGASESTALPRIARLPAEGQSFALSVLDDTRIALGHSLGTMINLFNLDLVVLEGRPLEILAPDLEVLTQSIRRDVMPDLFTVEEILTSYVVKSLRKRGSSR